MVEHEKLSEAVEEYLRFRPPTYPKPRAGVPLVRHHQLAHPVGESTNLSYSLVDFSRWSIARWQFSQHQDARDGLHKVMQ